MDESLRHVYAVGIDIGGTFADIVAVRDDGQMYTTKVSANFDDSVNSIMAGLRDLLTENAIPAASVVQIVHGTTVATNTILEHKGALTGLLTTAGFRDVLEIGRLRRPSLYDIFWDKPTPLVRRALRLELDERMTAAGEVQTPLRIQDVRNRLAALQEAGIQSLAVCLLNSYANPEHERLVAATSREAAPDLYLSVSAELLPEFREFERTSTTVINAYIQPAVDGYLEVLTRQFGALGLTAPVHIMQSNGGMTDIATTRRFPAHIVESGPAAGVLACSYLAQQAAIDNLIAFDMGGTTAKASLIEGGRISISTEYEVGAGLNSGRRLVKGAGYPLRVPSVDIAEVGAGGGSIAWIDAGGALQVGPQSAGAVPGPVCYNTGGTAPTVTDANLVLGYMNPTHLAGGRIKIDRELARAAIKEQIADPLGMDILEAAYGIHIIANATMIRAVRSVSTERGRDPRDYVLVCFGGAGPIHGPAMALSLEMPRVAIPISPGLFSAVGLLFADTTRDFVQSFLRRIDVLDVADLRARFKALQVVAGAFLAERGFGPEHCREELAADLRYVGQAYELTIPVIADLLAADDVAPIIAERFQREHELMYGYRGAEHQIEVVNLRVRAVGSSPKMPYLDLARSLTRAQQGDPSAAVGRRQAYFGPEHGLLDVQVLHRRTQLSEQPTPGPLIIEEFDTTVLVPPGAVAHLDRLGNILMRPA